MTILLVVSLAHSSVDMKIVSPVDLETKTAGWLPDSWVAHTKQKSQGWATNRATKDTLFYVRCELYFRYRALDLYASGMRNEVRNYLKLKLHPCHHVNQARKTMATFL